MPTPDPPPPPPAPEAEANLLNRFLRQHLPPGCVGAVRAILPGDEDCLTPNESRDLERAVLSVRRASGAGRNLARSLCARIGVPVTEILRSPQRDPLWPPGVIGSITHDASFAAAVVAPALPLGGLGIDIEPSSPLPPGVREMVASPEEIASFSGLPGGEKALFSIKEAVFKALYPHDRIFLDFPDVSVVRSSQTAATIHGRRLCWRVVTVPRVLAIAWWLHPADSARSSDQGQQE